MGGNARGATSAYCLLLRLGQLNPTDEQVQQMLDHTDSTYIRAVGASPFLPTSPSLPIWSWCWVLVCISCSYMFKYEAELLHAHID